MRWILLLVALACSSPRQAPEPSAPPAEPSAPRPARDALDAAVPSSDAARPATLDEALRELRARGLTAAADVIASRTAQRAPKMRLAGDAAHTAALAVLELANRPTFEELHAVMPRSMVELARAVRERGVPVADADAIAAYLVRVVATLAFERLARFDDNHSLVTGRQWHEIDYTGEGMTWQSQRAYWQPRGVASFRTAASIHAYFVGAARLPHWNRVYRPLGRIEDVAAP